MDRLNEQLRAAWQATRGGRGCFLHILAPVGAGKTTALGRFLEEIGAPSERVAVVSARFGDEPGAPGRVRGVVEELVVRVAEGVRAIEIADEPEDAAPASDDVPWLLPGGDFLAAATEIASLPPPASEEQIPPPTRAQIHAGLLMDVAREHPVLVVLDDAHRADEGSRHIIEALARRLNEETDVRLMVVLASAPPLREGEEAPAAGFVPDKAAVVPLDALDRDGLAVVLRGRLARFGEADETWLGFVLDTARGNPLVADALVQVAERAGALRREADTPLGDPQLAERPEFAGLARLAEGRLPELRAHVRSDVQMAAVVGRRFSASLLALLWSTPEEAALIRIDALRATGLVVPEGDRFSFLSGDIAAHYAGTLPDKEREALHARIATLLRASARAEAAEEPTQPYLDVTETWSESRRRDRRIHDELDMLWAASRHFAEAGRHAAAAEAAVTVVERLFATSGGHPYLAGRFGRRADRERRHRIYAALTEAAAHLDLARQHRPLGGAVDPEMMAIHVRLLTVRARFKEVMGDFTEARRHADAAVEVAGHLPEPGGRLEALRVRLEVCYAAGDANAAREALVHLVRAFDRAPRADTVRVLGWLAEALGRWEWPGLLSRLFPFIIERLQTHGAPREAVRARMDWLASVTEADEKGPELLVHEAITDAKRFGELSYLAEELARCAAELIQSQVDGHVDLLSGEFYPPDLYGEGMGPTSPPVSERLGRPVDFLNWAESLAAESGQRLSQLRVLTTMLGTIYETRERFADLLEQWMPVTGDERPMRLAELLHVLEQGFFAVEHVEAVSERVLALATELQLDQVIADTIYEALDRDLPQVVRRADSLFPAARAAYERVGDVYGMITLSLVQVRHLERRELDPEPAFAAGLEAFREGADQLSAEQRAFVNLRYGELFLERRDGLDEAIDHLEQAIELYDQIGDVEHVQTVGEILREVYRKQGDLGRYRALRERFRALEFRSPGVDPLGLELRIEHLLTLARQEADDERAIEMVEHCVQLFGRMPDGTTRIDECFVEISKICRRRADEAQTESGFQDWLRRSLDAVRIAASINRSLGNFHRVFEEFHELFDDLLGLGAYDEYVRARAESRELAFSVGNVAELLYLFEEHLQYDAETGTKVIRLPEVRGFYEALIRYLLGLGAIEQALKTQESFVGFLAALGEVELAEHYRAQRIAD
ncbi:MAG: AAA family ATPase [Myxococcales bacterium]|nr:AAA family ATPase [Myxococcales bacterium]